MIALTHTLCSPLSKINLFGYLLFPRSRPISLLPAGPEFSSAHITHGLHVAEKKSEEHSLRQKMVTLFDTHSRSRCPSDMRDCMCEYCCRCGCAFQFFGKNSLKTSERSLTKFVVMLLNSQLFPAEDQCTTIATNVGI